MKIWIVVPLYNEKKHINLVIKGILKSHLPIVVVDDGSRDNGNKEVLKLPITLLRHKVNLGKGAAMTTGADFAFNKGAEAVIFMDSDGQHSPQDILKFIQQLETNKYDVVFGSRNLNYGVPLVRYLGNKVASLVIRVLFGIYVSDPICGFRAITKDAYRKIKWQSSGYGVESEILARVGKNNLKFTEVAVDTIYHDKDKGVTILDAFAVLGDVLKWKLTK